MAKSLLTAFWIVTPNEHGPLRFGVTAFSIDDAINIIKAWGYELPDDRRLLKIQEGITIAELDERHVVSNMGPIVNRGIWYPFAGLGVPRWMCL